MINPRSVHFQKKKKGLLFEFSHLCTFNGIVCLSPQVPPQNTTTMTGVGGYVSYETLQLKRLEMEMWDCCCFDSVCSETPRRCEFCPQQKIHQNPARVLLGKARTWKTDAKKCWHMVFVQKRWTARSDGWKKLHWVCQGWGLRLVTEMMVKVD